MAGATLNPVAQRAGVSVSTASRTLAGNTSISATTRANVVLAAKELGYRRNTQACVAPQPHRRHRANRCQPRQPVLRRDGCRLRGRSPAPRFCHHYQFISRGRRQDGACGAGAGGPAGRRHHRRAYGGNGRNADVDRDRAPVVAFRPPAGRAARCRCLPCSRHARAWAHTRVGYLAGPQDTSTGRERLAVFTADTEDLETVIYQGEYRYKEGYVGTIELFESGVTAIIAGDSMMSFGALEACHNAGITIGEELALIGFDDFIFCVSSPRRSASSTRTWRRWDSSQLTHSSPQSTPNPLPLGCGAPRVFSRLSWAYPPTQTERDNVKLGRVSSLGLSQSHTADRTMPPR